MTQDSSSTQARNYPFMSKAQIAERISSDDDFVLMSLVILHDRQTEFEQATKTTVSRNRRGFMSSHAVNGTKLAQKVISGLGLEPEEIDKAREMVSHYTKQVASHLREEAKAANPELAATAAMYGV